MKTTFPKEKSIFCMMLQPIQLCLPDHGKQFFQPLCLPFDIEVAKQCLQTGCSAIGRRVCIFGNIVMGIASPTKDGRFFFGQYSLDLMVSFCLGRSADMMYRQLMQFLHRSVSGLKDFCPDHQLKYCVANICQHQRTELLGVCDIGNFQNGSPLSGLLSGYIQTGNQRYRPSVLPGCPFRPVCR